MENLQFMELSCQFSQKKQSIEPNQPTVQQFGILNAIFMSQLTRVTNGTKATWLGVSNALHLRFD